MIKVIGVKFRNAGKMYYFDPAGIEFEVGEKVIVETARGVEMGNVIMPVREVSDDAVVQPLKPIIRKANASDIEKAEYYQSKEDDAFKRCKEVIPKHGLEMKLVKAEYTYDGSKLIFFYTADGRVDFRELVKDLASLFRTRIELRQIGVRDEAMICGGLGVCGREFCCKSYLNDFVGVSIKMAKEQNLSLNPTKISGVCGRLMCCLKNEQETYEYLNSLLPNVGDEVIDKFEGTKGIVKDINVLRQKIKVAFKQPDDSIEEKEYSVDDLNFAHKKKEFDDSVEDEALKAIMKEDVTDDEPKQNHHSEKHDGSGRREGSQRHDGDEKRERHERHERHDGDEKRERHERHDGDEKRERHDGEEKRGRNHHRRHNYNKKVVDSREENHAEGGNKTEGHNRNRNRRFNRNRNHNRNSNGGNESNNKPE